MSYVNPNVDEVLEGSRGEYGYKLTKPLLNDAKKIYKIKYGVKPNRDNCQALRDIFEEQYIKSLISIID